MILQGAKAATKRERNAKDAKGTAKSQLKMVRINISQVDILSSSQESKTE
jgi:hypothetical protein